MYPATKYLIALISVTLLASQTVHAEAFDCVVEGAADRKTRTTELNAAEQEIMKMETASCHDVQRGAIDEMIAAIISDVGLLFLDGGPIVVGGPAQGAMFKEFLRAGFKIEWQPTDAFVSQSEDMAWAYGIYRLQTPDGMQDSGKYTSVWMKEDGAWKNVSEMRNSFGQQ